jgi:NADH-ubiquinone oxidoreductase chain 1
LIILVLVGVAFLVLLERRVLGYVHIRKGPNRVGFIGLFQPFRDAIRLF